MSKACRHENTTGYMWRERPALRDKDWFHAFVQPGKADHHDKITCDDCGAWLPLGPSNDEPEQVRVEMRAAEIAAELGGAAAGNRAAVGTHVSPEDIGWLCHVSHDLYGDSYSGSPSNDAQLAGYLARCIATHKDST